MEPGCIQIEGEFGEVVFIGKFTEQLPLIANARCFGRLELTGAGSLDHHRAIAEALKIAQSIELTLTDNIELATSTNSPKLNSVENEAELRAPNSTT